MHGDFNLDLLNVAHNNNCNDFYSTIATHGLYPSILRPTRVTSRTASLLDNIFINNIDVLEKAGVLLSDISDHFLLFCSLHLEDNNSGESSRYVEVTRRVTHSDNLDRLNQSINETDWNVYRDQDCSVDELYNKFSDKICNLYDRSCPTETRRIKILDKDKPYIDHSIKLLIKEKHRLQKLYNKWPIGYGSQYRAMRNKFNGLIKSDKSRYFRSKLDSSASGGKETWRTVNKLLGRNKEFKYPDQFFIDDVWVDDSLAIANVFNNHFASLGESLASCFTKSTRFLTYLENRVDTTFSFDPVTSDETKRVVLSLRNASPGIDSIPMSLFSKNIDALGDVIAFICNRSLEHGTFPARRAVAIITCLCKKVKLNALKIIELYLC